MIQPNNPLPFGRPRTFLRRQFAALLVGVTFVFAATAWAVSSPPGSAPDDDRHLPSIWCGWGISAGTCDPPATPGGLRRVRSDLVRAPCFAFNPEKSGACTYALGHELVAARTFDGEYPPVFYAAMRIFVGNSVATSVVLMRFANVLLGAVLLGAAVALASPLLRRSVTMAWLGTAVPLTMFLVPSTNPSSWAVIGIGTYWAFLLRFLSDGPRRGTWLAGAFAVLSATVAAGARADAAAYVALSTVAVLIVTSSFQDLRRAKMLLPLGMAAAGVAAFFSVGQSRAIGGFGTTSPPGERRGLSVVQQPVRLPRPAGRSLGPGLGSGMARHSCSLRGCLC